MITSSAKPSVMMMNGSDSVLMTGATNVLIAVKTSATSAIATTRSTVESSRLTDVHVVAEQAGGGSEGEPR